MYNVYILSIRHEIIRRMMPYFFAKGDSQPAICVGKSVAMKIGCSVSIDRLLSVVIGVWVVI